MASWIVNGIISAIIGIALLAIVFLIIRNQLKSTGKTDAKATSKN